MLSLNNSIVRHPRIVATMCRMRQTTESPNPPSVTYPMASLNLLSPKDHSITIKILSTNRFHIE